MPIRDASMSKAVYILYRNYRGETARRYILPMRVWFGLTEWHGEPQWLLDAVDLEKDAERSFAFRDILDFDCQPTPADVSR
ncbi:hypothetical protein ABZ399_27340 [Micromonospora aurantiaca]|uniref:hypothetical protein n=1 Tax=Micromonospora aurantiaca (nom. illeg.) TaxID=47850 RepID=UPI0033C487C6